jgi:small subunit ribosomal protein S16
MSVTIRLRRVGRNKQSNFRVVVIDHTAPRDGSYIEAIGFYNPRRKPAELRLDVEKLDAWVARGAELSDTVASLVRKAKRGGDRKVALMPVGGPPEPVAPVVAEPAKPRRLRARAPKAAEPRASEPEAPGPESPAPEPPTEPLPDAPAS